MVVLAVEDVHPSLAAAGRRSLSDGRARGGVVGGRAAWARRSMEPTSNTERVLPSEKPKRGSVTFPETFPQPEK